MLRLCCSHPPRNILFSFGILLFSIGSTGYLQGSVVHEPDKDKVYLCLTMAVENDEPVIEECLKSVKGVIDCISICDMGSTDKTLQLIEEFMEEERIPGAIYQYEGEKVGNRGSFLVKKARQTLERLELPLSTAYLMTIHPDMKLQVESSFRKEDLREDAYQLLEKSSSLAYSQYSTRILNASLPWENLEAIDGVWTYQGVWPRSKLNTLMISDEVTGKRKIHQLKNDVARLQSALKKEPDNDLYMLHLAQAYKGLNRYPEAIRYYEAGIEKNRNPEEIWFSKFMIGECYEASDMWENALYWYLEAYQYSPSRPESLQKLASYYRHRGKNDLAYIFAKHGLLIPYPENRELMMNPNPQSYQFNEELSIAAFYTNFRDEGFTATNDLILGKDVPWWTKSTAYINMQYYVAPLQGATYQSIDIRLPLVQEGHDERYHPMNPSICKTEDGYKVICRTVNYTQKDAKFFNTIDESGIFKTRNYLVEYDKNFKLLTQHEIIEDLPRERHRYFGLEGLDDCRIFQFNDEYWFTCTTSDTNPFRNFQISLCKLEDRPDYNIVCVEKLVPLHGPDPFRCEKNWLPFTFNGEFYVIYSYDPFVIYKPNLETGECEKIFEYTPSKDLSHFRGSAGPIAFDGGYLMVVHEVVSLPGHERRYLHRFVYLNDSFVVEKVSRPFTFLHLGIEYCCGMTLAHSGDEVVLSIGIEDREAYLSFVDCDVIRSLMNPIPK